MCILGKKYPMSLEEFRNSGLPGVFDPSKAGTRMKLPTPETWETLVSEKGNKVRRSKKKKKTARILVDKFWRVF